MLQCVLQAELTNSVPKGVVKELEARLESAEILLEAQVASDSSSVNAYIGKSGNLVQSQRTESLVSVLQVKLVPISWCKSSHANAFPSISFACHALISSLGPNTENFGIIASVEAQASIRERC